MTWGVIIMFGVAAALSGLALPYFLIADRAVRQPPAPGVGEAGSGRLGSDLDFLIRRVKTRKSRSDPRLSDAEENANTGRRSRKSLNGSSPTRPPDRWGQISIF